MLIVGLWVLRVNDEDPAERTETSFSREGSEGDRMAEAYGLIRIWAVEAKGANAAMAARNEYLGFEPYRPRLRDDGTPYPEDEDDDWASR